MDIGARMKTNYEAPARHLLVRRMPVVIRVDGKAFHSYTRHMDKPFDQKLMHAMVRTAMYTLGEMQGFKLAYAQSDEVSFLLTDYDTLQTEPWLGYVKSKLETVTASIFTAEFNWMAWQNITHAEPAYFDARAFNVPREEVSNYFLWRAKDWERNSVSMYCRAHFSHKEMDGKGRADQHEMLHSIGLNWTTDLSAQERNGTWIFGEDDFSSDIVPEYAMIANYLDPLIYCETEE